MSQSVTLHSSLLWESQDNKHLYERRCICKVMYLRYYLFIISQFISGRPRSLCRLVRSG